MSDRTAPATARLSLKEALDKVEARFLHNLPEEELSNIVRPIALSSPPSDPHVSSLSIYVVFLCRLRNACFFK
jgi:hypothetical protein